MKNRNTHKQYISQSIWTPQPAGQIHGGISELNMASWKCPSWEEMLRI